MTQPFLNLYHHHPPTGGALRAGFYLSFLTPYLGDDFVGFTSPPPTPTASLDKRRGSRCLMRVGLGSREQTVRFRAGLGTFRKLPPPSLLTPHLLTMAPCTRTPSSRHPRLSRPPPFWAPTNHPLQPPLLPYYLRPGSGLRVVPAAIPLSYTRGFSRPHLLLFTRAQRFRQPLAQPRLHQGLDPFPILAGHMPVPKPSSLGKGLTTLRPAPPPSPTPNCLEGHGNTGLRLPRTPSLGLYFPSFTYLGPRHRGLTPRAQRVLY